MCLPTYVSLRSGSVDRPHAGVSRRAKGLGPVVSVLLYAMPKSGSTAASRDASVGGFATPCRLASADTPKDTHDPTGSCFALWSLEILMRSTALSQSHPRKLALPEDLAHRPGADAEKTLGPGPRPALPIKVCR